jgi:hypothetical protein
MAAAVVGVATAQAAASEFFNGSLGVVVQQQ